VKERYLDAYLKTISRDVTGVTTALYREEKALRQAMRIEFENPDRFSKDDVTEGDEN
jgi:hypothetical protein